MCHAHYSGPPQDNPIHKDVAPIVSPIQHFEVEVGTKSSDVENQKQPAAVFSNSLIEFWNGGGKYLPAVIGALVAYIVLIVLASQQANSAESSSRSAIYTTPNIDNTGRQIVT